MKLSYEDRSAFEYAINEWARKNLESLYYVFSIHPAGKWAEHIGIKASAVVRADDEGQGVTKYTAVLRDDDSIIWWEQRAML